MDASEIGPDHRSVSTAEIAATSPLEWYWHFTQRTDFETDTAQLAVLEHIERLHNELEQYRQYRQGRLNRLVTHWGRGKRPPRGLYIWGPVGRGKTLLMDAFFSVSPLRRKRRVHFHEFMREVHQAMQHYAGEADPLKKIAADVAKKLRLLCLDEFHVSDIADAMILGRLLEQLIERGVVLVLTSNYHPDDLYPNGLQRARFLPTIDILKQQLDVVEIEGKTDHRRRLLDTMQIYHVPADEAAEKALAHMFSVLAGPVYSENGQLHIGRRDIPYRRRAANIVWFDFDALCVQPRSQTDYLEIAQHYKTVVISAIPQLPARGRADVVRRFTWLVDVFYDQRVKLICSAATEPEQLVRDDRADYLAMNEMNNDKNQNADSVQMVSAEFARTASRLREMQSREYFLS